MRNKLLNNYRYRGEVGQDTDTDTDTANERKGKERKGKEKRRVGWHGKKPTR